MIKSEAGSELTLLFSSIGTIKTFYPKLNMNRALTLSCTCFPLLHPIILVKIPLQIRRPGVEITPAVSWTLPGAPQSRGLQGP
jgi:hypothetical protein